MRICSFVKHVETRIRGLAERCLHAAGMLRPGPVPSSVVLASLGGAIGLLLLLVRGALRIPDTVAEVLFVIAHPLHVFVAAATLVRLLVRSGRFRPLPAAAVSYPLAIAIVTTVDSLLPFLGEWVLALPSRHVHIGFVEFWWIVHPLALAGTAVGLAAPRLRLPPALVLAASILPPAFDMMMAMWNPLDPAAVLTIAASRGIQCRESDVSGKQLLRAPEAFCTNALMGIMPLLRVDGRPIGAGTVGPVTRLLRKALDAASEDATA